jgi:hypothetical protein
MKTRLSKKQFLKLREGGPIGPRRKPYSRKTWRKELDYDGLENCIKNGRGVGLCVEEMEEDVMLSESTTINIKDKETN